MSTQTLCNVFKLNLVKGLENFNTGTPYTYKLALYSEAANLDASTVAYTTSEEITGVGYIAGGIALTPVEPALDAGKAIVSFINPVWSPATFTARYALVYNATTTAAVAVLDFGAEKIAVNSFTVQFPVADAENAIIRIA